MAGRSEQLRRDAQECTRRAEQSADPLIREEFTALALRFAELAEHIDRRSRRTIDRQPEPPRRSAAVAAGDRTKDA